MKLSFQNIANLKGILALITLLSGAYIFAPNQACAQNAVGCDNHVWRAMSNQAVMQTRRQDIMNKRYIIKADSVLQYSCFDQELVNVMSNTGKMFSNGDQWENLEEIDLLDGFTTSIAIYDTGSTTQHGAPTTANGFDVREGSGHTYKSSYNPAMLSPDTLETAITDVIFASYEAYLEGQFNHLVLSGTTYLTNTLSPPPLCYNMSDVWQAAKCKNFDDVDIFMDFRALIESDDPREFPPNMPCIL